MLALHVTCGGPRRMGVLAGAALEKVGEDSLKPAFQSGSSRPLAEWYGAGVQGGRSSSGCSIPVCKLYDEQMPSQSPILAASAETGQFLTRTASHRLSASSLTI